VPAVRLQRVSVQEEKVKIRQPRLLSGGTLRDYQLEGYQWLKVRLLVIPLELQPIIMPFTSIHLLVWSGAV